MNKIILTILITISYIYAKQECIFYDHTICVYVQEENLSSQMIIENLSKEYDIKIIDSTVMLDGVTKTIKDIWISKQTKITVIKSKYENINRKPFYTVGIINYHQSDKKNKSSISDEEKNGKNGHIEE